MLSFYPLLTVLKQTLNPKQLILYRNGTLVIAFDEVPLTVNQANHHLTKFRSYADTNQKDLVITKSHIYDHLSSYCGFFDEISTMRLLLIEPWTPMPMDLLKARVTNQLMSNLNQDLEKLEIIFDSNVNKMEDFEPVMYLFVNHSLNMGKGKIAGQVAHAACKLVEKLVRDPTPAYLDWSENLHKKVVLKASAEQLEQLKVLPGAMVIHDAGRTQIPSNSLTVVGFPPTYQSQVPKEFTSYKLL